MSSCFVIRQLVICGGCFLWTVGPCHTPVSSIVASILQFDVGSLAITKLFIGWPGLWSGCTYHKSSASALVGLV
jgi:hypothetical protein